MDKEWEEWVAAEQGQVVNVSVMRAAIVNHTSKDSPAIRRNVPNADRLWLVASECSFQKRMFNDHTYVENCHVATIAAVAAVADGLIIETHNNPSTALCDGEQSVTQQQLAEIIRDASRIRSSLYPDGYRFPAGVACN